ncbi:MAG: hypothetical protein NC120_03915 [Ruminococcus sp.]|nr:hypothetical protein [Ruminococcus sp.]
MVKVFPVVFVILEILQAVFPEYARRIEHGMPKDKEPSDEGIFLVRAVGILFAVVGTVMFFTASD